MTGLQKPASSGKVISFFIFLEVLILLGSWLIEDHALSAIQTATRISGRLSFFLFVTIFILYHYRARLESWLSQQYYLVFAIVHGIHLILLLTNVSLNHIPFIPYRLAGGFLAYAFIFIMPWIVSRVRSGKMKKSRFSILENIYLYYVWFIFFMTYFSRVQGKLPNTGGSREEHLALFGLVLVVLIAQLIIRFRRRNAITR